MLPAVAPARDGWSHRRPVFSTAHPRPPPVEQSHVLIVESEPQDNQPLCFGERPVHFDVGLRALGVDLHVGGQIQKIVAVRTKAHAWVYRLSRAILHFAYPIWYVGGLSGA